MQSMLPHLHAGLAALSILGFIGRGGWLLATGHRPGGKFLKIAPHVVDTLLLLTGLILLGMLGWAMATTSWMALKLILVVVYIAFGIATFRASQFNRRLLFFILAVLSFAQIMAIAFTRDAAGLLGIFTG